MKGPADHLLRATGNEVSALGVARLYREIAAGFVLDHTDATLEPAIAELGLRTRVTETLMSNIKISEQLARKALELSEMIS